MIRKPTIMDVAREAAVSTATVSRVLNKNQRVADATRARVMAAIESVGYRFNGLARTLVTGRSGIVGIVIPDIAGVLYSQIARGIEDVLDPQGMHIAIATSDRDESKEARAISQLLSRKVDGLVLIGSRLEEHELTEVLDAATPTVLMQREVSGSREDHTGTELLLDNTGGTRQALEHLLAAGHVNIVHIAGVRHDGFERRVAYEEFMFAHSLPSITIQSDSTEEGGYTAYRLLTEFPETTAVYCSNDRIAVGLYRALAEEGKRIPDDLSIIGFDDLPWCAYLNPPLTTIRQDGRAMGRAAGRAVVAKLTGQAVPANEIFKATLVPRGSVGSVIPRQFESSALERR